MPAAELHPREFERLQELKSLEMLDSTAEDTFDAIVRLAASICGSDISLVSLVDRERQWFKARHGLETSQTHRDQAFCSHAILNHEEILEVVDASCDPRFADNPLVIGGPKIRFYAGVPLRGPVCGLPMGTLCVIDSQPRELDEGQRQALRHLAQQVEQLLTMRRAAIVLKQQNDTLNQAMRNRIQFLATINHDVRTPLASILGAAELLQEQVPSGAGQQLCSSIIAAGESLQHLFNDLSTLVRYEDGRVRLQQQPFDLRALFADCMQVVAVKAEVKGLRCHVEVAPAIPGRVVGDTQRLRQILINLLANAVKFSDQGTITLAAKKAQSEQDIIISVGDQGPGISPADVEHIFDPYVQLPSEASQSVQGSGLGLAIVRNLAALMGGNVRVQSDIGQGSTFILSLPLPAEDEAERLDIPATPVSLSGLSCLVVDDDLLNRQVIVAMLQQLGCQAEAQAELPVSDQQLHRYDVLLIDEQLGQASGSAYCRQLRQQEYKKGVTHPQAVVLISGDPDAIPADVPAQEVLGKPLNLHRLRKALEPLIAVQQTVE